MNEISERITIRSQPEVVYDTKFNGKYSEANLKQRGWLFCASCNLPTKTC